MSNADLKYLVLGMDDSNAEKQAFVSDMLKKDGVCDDNVTFASANKYSSLNLNHNCFYARNMYEEARSIVLPWPYICMSSEYPVPSDQDNTATWRRVREVAYTKLLESKGPSTQITGRMSK